MNSTHITPTDVGLELRVSPRTLINLPRMERILPSGELVMSQGTKWFVVTGKLPIGVPPADDDDCEEGA